MMKNSVNNLYLETKVPSVNHYWKLSGSRRYLSVEGRRFKQLVARQARVNHFVLLEGDIEVTVHWFKKGKKKGDLDNILKVIMDSLNNVAYQDDKQVKSIIARMWEHAGKDGVFIQVSPFEPTDAMVDTFSHFLKISI